MSSREAFGTIYRGRSGNYVARYQDPLHNSPGRAPWISAPQTFRTKTAARAWLAGVRADIERGVWKHPDKARAEEEARERAEREALRPFGPYAEQWLTTRRLKQSTLDGYRPLLRVHILPKWGQVPIRQITTADVRAWIGSELAPNHPGSRKHAYDLFKTIMATAVDDDIITANPCKRNMLATTAPAAPGTSSRHAPRALSASEVAALADEVPDYLRALILFLAVTGLRMGEALELRRSDIDLKAGAVSVTRAVTGSGSGVTVDTPKTRAGVRVVYLDETMIQILTDHIAKFGTAGADGLVFHPRADASRHIPRRTLQLNIERACERLRIPKASPHDLRHTAASLAGRTPGIGPRDVQDMLGHETPGMAMRYMHSDKVHQQRISAQLSGEVMGALSARGQVSDLDAARRRKHA